VSHWPWNESRFARLKLCVPVFGVRKVAPMAVPARPVCEANAVPAVSGDRPRSGW